MVSNNYNNNDNSDELGNKREDRVCICDCNTGHFITNLNRDQVNYIYQTLVRANVKTGDYIQDLTIEGAIESIIEIKDYLAIPYNER